MFSEREEKERFLLVLGLLASRTVTLAKAAEILGMWRSEFSGLLKTIGFQYSYSDKKESNEDIKASKSLLKKRYS